MLDGKQLQRMVISMNFATFRSRPGSRPIQTRSRLEVATPHTYPTITATCSCLTMPAKKKQNKTTKTCQNTHHCSPSCRRKTKSKAPRRGSRKRRPLRFPVPLIVTTPIWARCGRWTLLQRVSFAYRVVEML